MGNGNFVWSLRSFSTGSVQGEYGWRDWREVRVEREGPSEPRSVGGRVPESRKSWEGD